MSSPQTAIFPCKRFKHFETFEYAQAQCVRTNCLTWSKGTTFLNYKQAPGVEQSCNVLLRFG